MSTFYSTTGAPLPQAWEDAWDAYAIPKRASLSDRTLANYRDTFGQLSRFVGGDKVAPEDLTPRHVAMFLESVVQQASGTTAAMRWRGLSAVINYLAKRDEDGESYLPKNPMRGIRPPKSTEVPPPVLAMDDVRRVIKACSGPSVEDIRDEAIIRVLFDTGIRRGELVSMQTGADWLNLREGTARVDGKTGQRIIDLGDKTSAAIFRYMKRRKASHYAGRNASALWIGLKGPMTGNGVYQALAKRFALAGVKAEKLAHVFRHTFSHEYRAAGGNLDDLVALNGWSSPAMALRYGKSAANERARAAHRKLALGDRL